MLIYTIENICFASWPLHLLQNESCSFACYESYLRQMQFVAALSPCWNCYASHQDLKAVPLLAMKAIWDKHSSLLLCHLVEIFMPVIKIWKLFLCYTTESCLRQAQFIIALSPGWNYYASHQDLKAVPLLATPLKAIWGKHVFVATSRWNCYNSHRDLKAVPLLATPVKTIWHKHALLLLCVSSRSKSCSFARYTIESCLRQMRFVATLSPQWKWNCYTSHQDLYLCACLF